MLLRPRQSTLLAALASAMFATVGAGAQARPTQVIELRGGSGGKRFEGVGVVEGGGGTGVLLKDSAEPRRSQILDLLFTPRFGASVSALLIEIPGDGNSTQGSMPSHMRTRDDLHFGRGYMWWELREARRRNPRLSLDGAAWSAPGWVGTRGRLFQQSTGTDYRTSDPFFSEDAVHYYVQWLRGLRDVWGLELDAIGSRNDKGTSYDFAKAFRKALNANGFARWPWGGHYRINPALWGYAHYGQFSEIGWTYLNGGSGALAGGAVS